MPAYWHLQSSKQEFKRHYEENSNPARMGLSFLAAVACTAGIPVFPLSLGWVEMAVSDGEARRLE